MQHIISESGVEELMKEQKLLSQIDREQSGIECGEGSEDQISPRSGEVDSPADQSSQSGLEDEVARLREQIQKSQAAKQKLEAEAARREADRQRELAEIKSAAQVGAQGQSYGNASGLSSGRPSEQGQRASGERCSGSNASPSSQIPSATRPDRLSGMPRSGRAGGQAPAGVLATFSLAGPTGSSETEEYCRLKHEENARLHEQVAALEAQLQAGELRLKDLEGELRASQDREASLGRSLQEAEDRAQRQETKRKGLEEASKQAQCARSELSRKAAAESEARREAEETVLARQKDLDREREATRALRDSLGQTQGDLDSLRAAHDTLAQEHSALESSHHETNLALAQLRAKLKGKEDHIARLDDRISELEAANGQLERVTRQRDDDLRRLREGGLAAVEERFKSGQESLESIKSALSSPPALGAVTVQVDQVISTKSGSSRQQPVASPQP